MELIEHAAYVDSTTMGSHSYKCTAWSHVSGKDHKHMLAGMFLNAIHVWLCFYMIAIIASSDPSQGIFAIDMLTAIKSTLNHSPKPTSSAIVTTVLRP